MALFTLNTLNKGNMMNNDVTQCHVQNITEKKILLHITKKKRKKNNVMQISDISV